MQKVDSLEKILMLGGIGAGGEGDDRGWNGCMASSTRWTWVWVNPRSWWWTGRPGVLQFMGSQRVRHDWATELNWVKSAVAKNGRILWAKGRYLTNAFSLHPPTSSMVHAHGELPISHKWMIISNLEVHQAQAQVISFRKFTRDLNLEISSLLA